MSRKGFRGSPNRHSIASRGADTVKLLDLKFPLNATSFSATQNLSFPPFILSSYKKFAGTIGSSLKEDMENYDSFIIQLQKYVFTRKLTQEERNAILVLLLTCTDKIKRLYYSNPRLLLDIVFLFQYMNLPKKYISRFVEKISDGSRHYDFYFNNMKLYKRWYKTLKDAFLPPQVLQNLLNSNARQHPVKPNPIERGFETQIMFYLLNKLAKKQYLSEDDISLFEFYKFSIYSLISDSLSHTKEGLSVIETIYKNYPDLIFMREGLVLVDKLASFTDLSTDLSHSTISHFNLMFRLPIYDYEKVYSSESYHLLSPNILLPSLETLFLLKPSLNKPSNKDIFKKYMIAIELNNNSLPDKPSYYSLLTYTEGELYQMIYGRFINMGKTVAEVNDFISFLLAYQKYLTDQIKPYYYIDYEKLKEETLNRINNFYDEYSLDIKRISHYYKQLSKLPLQKIFRTYIDEVFSDVISPSSKSESDEEEFIIKALSGNADTLQSIKELKKHSEIKIYLDTILNTTFNLPKVNFYVNFITSLPYKNPYITILSPYLFTPSITRMMIREVPSPETPYVFDKSPLTEDDIKTFERWWKKPHNPIKDNLQARYNLSLFRKFVKSYNK